MKNPLHNFHHRTHSKFGFHSVFARLFISVFLALIVFAVAMIVLTQIIYRNPNNIHLHTFASQITNQIDPFLTTVDAMTANHDIVNARFMLLVVKKTIDNYDRDFGAKIGVYNHEQRLIAQTENTELPLELKLASPKSSQIIAALTGHGQQHILLQTTTGYTVWYESRTPPSQTTLLGILNLFTGTMLLLIIMSAVLWWITHNITWRINQMSQQMAKLGDGDFNVRVSEQGNDEIAMLAYGFNQSAQKIERLINANSLLLAHASHEFRTPITRIRLQIEMMDMLAQKLSDQDKERFNKRACAINKDLTGLNDLVESILLVSRLDAGHALQNAESVDLYELVKNECQHYPQATLFATPVSITAQPKLLTHLVRNLLNNAIIHGEPPIEVYLYTCTTPTEAKQIPATLTELMNQTQALIELEQVPPNTDTPAPPTQTTDDHKDSQDAQPPKNSFLKRLTRKDKNKSEPEANYAVLAVIDQGTGIAADKREAIFNPFVRLKQEKKGSGLGLSLVAQITEAHQGQISTDIWQGKTRFLVVLPLKPKTGFGENER